MRPAFGRLTDYRAGVGNRSCRRRFVTFGRESDSEPERTKHTFAVRDREKEYDRIG